MKRLRMVSALAVLACALLALPAAASAAGTGSIAGQVTDSATGGAISSTGVCAYTATTDELEGCGFTNSSGVYVIDELGEGAYKVEFEGGFDFSEATGESNDYEAQWYNDKPSFATADQVTVIEGEVTSGINAALRGLGRISGTVINSVNGAPVAGIEVCVDPVSETGFFEFFFNCTRTNAAGQYLSSGLSAGGYKVEFRSPFKFNEVLERSELEGPNYVTQYYSAQARPDTAAAVTVLDGTITPGVNAAMVPGATITGTVTDAVTNATLQGVEVCAWGPAEYQCSVTDTVGNYVIPTLTPGAYKVEFAPETFFSRTLQKEGKRAWVRSELPLADYARQYWNDKLSFEAAEPVTLATGATAVAINAKLVKEVQPPPPPPPPGIGIVGKKAKVKGGKALLHVKCHGVGACKGTIKLTARAVSKPKAKPNHKGGKAHKSARKGAHEVPIGKASFAIPVGKSRIVRVKLNGAGKLLVSQAGAKGLKAKVSGTGVKKGTVKLKAAAAKKKGHGKKGHKPAKPHKG